MGRGWLGHTTGGRLGHNMGWAGRGHTIVWGGVGPYYGAGVA